MSRISQHRRTRPHARFAGSVCVLVTLLTPAAAFGQASDAAVGDAPTFTRDVMPILQASCQECHQPGSIGPMSLMTYEEVRPWAEVIKLRVVEQEMPPYHYDVDVGIQALKHDRRLSAEAIETIAAWVDAGAPQGDLADMPPPAEFPDPAEWRLASTMGPPDLVIASTPYDVPATGNDIWWQPLVDSGITEEGCIMAMEVKPRADGRSATHHANPYWRFPDENGVVRPGPGGEAITEYALGKMGEVVPKDACRIARPGAMVGWDIHYYPPGDAVEDHVVELGIWLHPDDYKSEYTQTLRTYQLDNATRGLALEGMTALDRMIDLPPHSFQMTQGFHRFDTPVRIDSFQPHGHLRLKAKKLEVIYPDGRREIISMISNWNPGWHLSHMYEDDVAPLLPVGSTMVITAWYDNTADNPHNPDPDQWVGWGQRTSDEMSHAWIAITHLDQAGYDRLVSERAGSNATEGAAGE